MVAVFYWILNMSILGSLVGVIVLILRQFKVIPRKFVYLSWGFVFLRFLCPLGFMNGISFLHLLPQGSVRIVDTKLNDMALSYTNFMQTAESYQPMKIKDELAVFYEISASVWIVIVVAAILSNAWMYYLSSSELKKAQFLKDNIYESAAVSSPLVFRIIHPRIVIPVGISQSEQLKYLLAHETTHIRHKDNLWRMAAILTACLHWFNPLVWICLHAFLTDMELACDECTIRNLKKEERIEYAETLLSYAKARTTVYAASFGGKKVKLRIERVITYKRITLASSVCFCVLFVAFAMIVLSNQ